MIGGLKVFAKKASCNTMRILLAEDRPLKSSPAVSTATKRLRILFTTMTLNCSVYCLEDDGEQGELLCRLNPPNEGYIPGGLATSEGNDLDGKEIWSISCNNSPCGSGGLELSRRGLFPCGSRRGGLHRGRGPGVRFC